MLINCDIGERGVGHEVDDVLMCHIDIANIACGGHAGDAKSIAHYKALAQKHNVKITAHLSYEDKQNFGRKVLDISHEELLKSLDVQLQLFGQAQAVKFHGALYNQANIDTALANLLAQWLKQNGITQVLAPHGGALYKACSKQNIEVLLEAFADRAYINTPQGLQLAPRDKERAVHEDIDTVMQQVTALKSGHVTINGNSYTIKADTVCVHSDSHQALEMVKALCSIR